jgi:hypothetical protein
MTAFEKWNGFIEQLIYFECPTDNEKSRLQAELSVIEKTNGAEVFQAIYDAWHILNIKGIHSYITGEAEEWFIFYFLDMVRENSIKRKLPTQIPSKTTFVIPQGAKEKANRVALTWRLPENTYEMEEG